MNKNKALPTRKLYAFALLVQRKDPNKQILKSGFALGTDRNAALSEAYMQLRGKYPRSDGWTYNVAAIEIPPSVKAEWL